MSASLAIALFVNGVALGVLMLPRWFSFSKNQFGNLVIKRCLYVIGIYLFMLNSAIIATLAAKAGITVTEELFRYMWLFGTAGWVAMLMVIIKTLFDLKDMYSTLMFNKRMGKNG